MLALKKAEQSDEIVVRVVEIDGKPASQVHVAFASPILAAREINGQEQPVGPARVQGGELVASFSAYQPRSFAIKLNASPTRVIVPQFATIKLPYDVSVASLENQPASGCFDCSFDRPTAPQGKALPAEMLPGKVDYAGVSFTLVPATSGKPNAVTTEGQTIHLPAGKFNRLYLLAAANGDQKAEFKVGDKSVNLNVQDWTGFVGQWDDRIWKTTEEPIPQRVGAPPHGNGPHVRLNEYGEMIDIRPGYIKRADIGWFASHRHDAAASNEPYAYSYLFAYAIDVPSGASTFTLPRNHNIRILAATAANQSAEAWSAQPLYDVLDPADNRTRE
jgi:alpha-mannosidase